MTLPPAPPEITRPLERLHTLAQLLQCADLARWASQARPCPHALADLIHTTHADLAAGLAEHFEPPQS